MSETAAGLGLLLPNGCRIVHGDGADVKRPFADIPVVMHELSAGGEPFAGQFGVIPFDASLRLPRHIHMAGEPGRWRLAAERILVTGGVGLVELNGEVVLVPPLALVTVAPGVPHSWTACPAGVRLPDGTVSDGRFLMVYDYAEATRFFPCDATATVGDAAGFREYEGPLERIRFPEMSAGDVVERAGLAWDRSVARGVATLA